MQHSQSTQESPKPQSRHSFATELRDLNAIAYDAEPPQSIDTTLSGPRGTPTSAARARSSAATTPSIASSPASDSPAQEFDVRFTDKFDGIDWGRLPAFTKPLRTQKFNKSALYQYGYRVALQSDTRHIYFVCRYCHIHNVSGSQMIKETKSLTTAAWKHVERNRTRHFRPGKEPTSLESGQRTLAGVICDGVNIPQEVFNALGNFNQQRFRLVLIS